MRPGRQGGLRLGIKGAVGQEWRVSVLNGLLGYGRQGSLGYRIGEVRCVPAGDVGCVWLRQAEGGAGVAGSGCTVVAWQVGRRRGIVCNFEAGQAGHVGDRQIVVWQVWYVSAWVGMVRSGW